MAVVLAACGPRALVDSDAEPAPGEALRAGRDLLAGGDLAGATMHWQGLLRAHPTSWEAARGLQDTLRASVPALDFEALYRRNRDAAPADGLAWYLWGRARIDDEVEARGAFERAAALAPQSPWPPAALAYLRWRAGDLFLTVETYEEALERLPGSATLRLLLGNQLIQLRLTVAAERHLLALPRVWRRRVRLCRGDLDRGPRLRVVPGRVHRLQWARQLQRVRGRALPQRRRVCLRPRVRRRRVRGAAADRNERSRLPRVLLTVRRLRRGGVW